MKSFPVKEILLGAAAAVLAYLGISGVNVLPVVFLAAVAWLMYQSVSLRNPSGSAMRSPATTTVPEVRFEDIGGQAAAKKELLEAIEFITNREQIARMGIRPLKGILLTGPPGTGKTLLAKAAAHHTNSVFLAAAGSEFVEMYAGVGAQRVRELFRRAREAARKERKRSAIIFIDEMEVLGARRGSHSTHMEYDQTLNQLLTEMDGIAVDEEVQVLVMGATNRVDMMDPALLRPGRFDRTVNVDLPDKEARLAILKLHTRKKPLAEDVDLEAIARQTFGFSGAHLESLTNEAAILALREGLTEVRHRHFVEAVDKVMLGEKVDRTPTPAEKRRIAVHEAGHALVGEWVDPGSVATVTVTPRGRALGYVRTSPADDQYLYTRSQLEARIQVALAGFLAEELVFGEASTGAANDFEQAVGLARHIVHAGLSPLGIVDAQTLDRGLEGAMVQQIIADQRELVIWFLSERRSVLERVANILVDAEVIEGEEIRRLLADAPPLPPVQGPLLPETVQEYVS